LVVLVVAGCGSVAANRPDGSGAGGRGGGAGAAAGTGGAGGAAGQTPDGGADHPAIWDSPGTLWDEAIWS